MPKVVKITGREILDSRGTPTVLATCELAGGARASASVPSGRSTGAGEALELRDADPQRYRGKGCRKAVANVGHISLALAGSSIDTQQELDRRLVQLDGTANKSRLGANAILAVSLAFARAHAIERGLPLYQHFADMIGQPLRHIPRLTINLFSGGKHAGQQVAIQDVLIVPSSPTSVDGSMVMMHNIYHAAVKIAADRFGMRWLTADEGGLAPPCSSAQQMIGTAVEAITTAGCRPGVDADIALDVASSHFFVDGLYHIDGQRLEPAGMIDLLARWADEFPIVSLEDGLAEDQWDIWPALQRRLGSRLLVLGDDFLCTNPQRIQRAIDAQACNALLLKVNQIGTLSEAAQALKLARSAGWKVTISVRSGETEDDWAADLCVGWGGDQFKNGSITQSERLAKYNRLLEIESLTGLKHNAWPR
jgi:enolase